MARDRAEHGELGLVVLAELGGASLVGVAACVMLGAMLCRALGPGRAGAQLLRNFQRLAQVVLLLWGGGTGCAPTARPGSKPPQSSRAPALPWEARPAVVPNVQSPLIALVGASVMTAVGPDISDGVVLLENGRIRAVGKRGEVQVPPQAKIVDLAGSVVTPGLIDTHSHMGVFGVPQVRAHADGNESTAPVTPQVNAADSFWPQDPALSRALASGVTAALVLPGSANLIGGQGVTIKLAPGRSAADMRFAGAPMTLKMACGENPKRVYGGRKTAPSTRMGNVAGYRQAFQRAVEYGAKFNQWQEKHRAWQERGGKGTAPSMPARDFGLETLLGALEGRVLVQVHCYRADEMLRMIALSKEFGFRIRAFHHAVEAYKIRDVLANEGVAVATWADWWGFKMEAYDAIFENLSLLSTAGVISALHSDSPSLVQRLNQEAAKARTIGRRSGIRVKRRDALRWITFNPAWTLGIERAVGSLEAGKMADVVVWNGDPFSVYSKVESVYVDGQRVFQRSAPGRRPSDFELGQGVSTGEEW